MSPASDRCKSCLKSTLRYSLLLTVLATVASTTGCTTFHNGFRAMASNGSWNDSVVTMRNRSMSAKAWHQRKHHFCKERHINDFCAGFKAGYEASAQGSDGCTPSFPPKNYWSWEFQSGEGQARTAAWFAGYPHGARAAEEDGVSNWNQLPMSAGLQAQYQQTGKFTHEGAVYPIPEPSRYGGSIGSPVPAGPIMGGAESFQLMNGLPAEFPVVP
jgi:hypothetical protein